MLLHLVDYTVLRAGLATATGWEAVDRKAIDGVGDVVVRYKRVGEQDCLEGSASTSSSPDALLAAATAVEDQPRWSSWKVAESRILGGSASSFDYYQVLDNPSPVADRVWFLHATSGRRGDERVFAWEQIDGATAFPEAWARVKAAFPGAVPTTVNVGDWTFTPGPSPPTPLPAARREGMASSTSVRYRICTDAGGNIPRWVGEYAARRTLPTNVADIVLEVGRRERAAGVR